VRRHLQKNVLHRLYPTQYTYPLKAEVIERDAVFVPAGWDSQRRIDDILDHHGSGVVSADAQFNDVIKFPPGASAAGTGAGGSDTPSEPSLRAPE
jgi:hypothetical protein